MSYVTEDCFLRSFFKGRVLCKEKALKKNEKISLGANFEHEGRNFTLASVKIEQDGFEFWGARKHCVRAVYVAEAERSLEEELQRVANFSALKGARKAASRLELLQSPGTVVSGFATAPRFNIFHQLNLRHLLQYTRI